MIWNKEMFFRRNFNLASEYAIMEVQEYEVRVTLCETRHFLVTACDIGLLDENVTEGLCISH